jgi:hypothetical protein
MSLRANDHAVISLFYVSIYCAAGNYEAGCAALAITRAQLGDASIS